VEERCPNAAGAAVVIARKKFWRSTLNFIKCSAESTTLGGKIKSPGINKKKLYLD